MSGLDTMSLTSDTPPGAQVIWAGGACGALAYESVGELRVAVESLQRLHAELQEETRNLTARVEESRAADAAGRSSGDDPLASYLLEAAGAWMVTLQTTAPGDEQPEKQEDLGRSGGSGLLMLPASVGGHRSSRHLSCDGNNYHNHAVNDGWRRSLHSKGKRTNLRTPSGGSGIKEGKIGVARRWSNTGTGGRGQRGLPLPQDEVDLLPSSSSTMEFNGGGALAAATTSSVRRRELFYHLVDAFRDYQTTEMAQQTNEAVDDGAGVDGEGLAGGGERGKGRIPGVGSSTAAAAGDGAEGGVGIGGNIGDQFPPIGVLCGGGGRESGFGGGGTSASDNISLSVRTLCDFGPPECRSVSTQTIAKVGGHCICIAGG